MIIEKLNTICHRHNRWLFGILTVVIIFSFIMFLTPGNFGLDFSGGDGTPVGTAFGEKVTFGDLNVQRRKMLVFYQVFFRISPDLPAKNIFDRICVERKAEAMGLAVSDSEVAAALKSLPFLCTDGKYDPEKYKALVEQNRNMGISEKDLIEACRSQILIEKLQNEITGSITVTDSEAKELFRELNTTFSGKLFEFPPVAIDKKAKVDAKALEEYFNKNSAKYTITGNVSALIAVFAAKNYEASAAKEANAETLKKFFETNKSNYGSDKDFAAVQDKVKQDYIDSRALVLARNAAYEFARSLYEDIDGKSVEEGAKLFRKGALDKKLDLLSGVAKIDEKSIAGVESLELVKALSAAGEPVPMTEPVVSGKKVCVGFTVHKTPTRNAEFAEAEKTLSLLDDFRRDEAAAQALKRAEDCAKALADLKTAEEKSKFIAGIKDCKVTDIEFSYIGKTPAPGKELATYELANLNIGDYSNVTNTAVGPAIVTLTKRTAPDMSNFDANTYKALCFQQKMSIAMHQLQETLARECSYNPPEGLK